MFNHKKLIPQKRAVFTLTLKHNVTEDYEDTDYQRKRSESQRTYDNLAPNGNFAVRFRKGREHNENDGMANYSDIRDCCERVINDEIANELRELIDLSIKEVKVDCAGKQSVKGS